MSFNRLLLILLISLGFSLPVMAVTPEKGKVQLLYPILQNVIWPNEAELKHLTIGMYGDDRRLARILKKEVSSYHIRGLEVKVVKYTDLKKARAAQVLMVSKAYNAKLADIHSSLNKSGTLLVTEESADKRNVMVNFVYAAGEKLPFKQSGLVLSFEINRDNVVYTGLKLTKDILLFGGEELDVATIHKETEAELARAVTTADQQKKTLDQQQNKLKLQQLQLKTQKEAIERKTLLLTSKEGELAKLEEGLGEIKAAFGKSLRGLKENENLLSEKENLLTEKETVLAAKQADIESYSVQIRKNLEKLDAQRDELTQQKRLIDETKGVLQLQGDTIERQQSTLIAAAAVLALVLLLVVLIFRNAIEKQRVNKELERQSADLETANNKLQEMAEAKSLFLSTMSHEIRTPLNGVLGMVELLKDTKIDGQQARYLDTIHSSGDVLLNVINDILDFSKIEAGEMPVEAVAFDLEKVLYSCASIFVLRSRKDLKFRVELPHDVPRKLMGDPMRIRQVLLNLLSNAFKFTRQGHITLAVSWSGGEPNRCVKISVEDTGPGLSQEQRVNIFSAFAQADASITRRYGGTGLGLAISRRLVTLMGGDLNVASELGKGARFTFSLPLVENKKSKPQLLTDLNGRYLMMLAPPEELQYLKPYFKVWGLELAEVATKDELIRLVSERRPDYLLLPQEFEGVSTLVLAEEIKPQLADEKIIILGDASAVASTAVLNIHGVSRQFDLPMAPAVIRGALAALLDNKKGYVIEPMTEISSVVCYSKLRVLVAEDNTVNQMVIKGLLAKLGVAPTIVENGLQAVEAFHHHEKNNGQSFDLILMDCEMPEMDGLTATREIRKLEVSKGYKRTPIVALTAHAMEEHKRNVLAAGMDCHLAKPVKADVLQSLLERYA